MNFTTLIKIFAICSFSFLSLELHSQNISPKKINNSISQSSINKSIIIQGDNNKVYNLNSENDIQKLLETAQIKKLQKTYDKNHTELKKILLEVLAAVKEPKSITIDELEKKIAAYSFPFFSKSDDRIKILVLPFNKQCEYQGKAYDIGFVITQRLRKISDSSNLNLNVYFDASAKDLENINEIGTDSILKYHNADQLIYGTYSLKECESDNINKVCFNYKSNLFGIDNPMSEPFEKYRMVNFNGLDEIRTGKGQESIDFIIYLSVSVSLTKQKKYELSNNILLQLNNYREYPIILNAVGFNYYLAKDYYNSKKYFSLLLKIDSTKATYWENYSNTLLHLKDYNSATIALERSLKIDSTNSIKFSNLGLLYLQLNDSKNSRKFLERGIVNNTSAISWVNLAYSYFDEGVYKESNLRTVIKSYDYLLQSRKLNRHDSILVLYQQGMAYLDLEEFYPSEKKFQTITKIDPNIDSAWFYIGVIKYRNKEYVNAKSMFEKTVSINQNHSRALSFIGDIYDIKYKNYNKAIEYYTKAAKVDTKNYVPLYNIGRILFTNLRDTLRSLKYIEQAYKLNPSSEELILILVLEYNNNKNKEKALFYIQKLISINPKYIPEIVESKKFAWLSKDENFNSLLMKVKKE